MPCKVRKSISSEGLHGRVLVADLGGLTVDNAAVPRLVELIKGTPSLEALLLRQGTTVTIDDVAAAQTLADVALEHDVAIYFEANGHGAVLFSPRAVAQLRHLAEKESAADGEKASLGPAQRLLLRTRPRARRRSPPRCTSCPRSSSAPRKNGATWRTRSSSVLRLGSWNGSGGAPSRRVNQLRARRASWSAASCEFW